MEMEQLEEEIQVRETPTESFPGLIKLDSSKISTPSVSPKSSDNSP